MPLAARGLGLAYALAILVLWHRARVEPAGLLALVTVPGFAMWTWGGLETISAGFWMLLAMVLLWRRRERPWALSSKLLAALSLTFVALGRPEGIVVALAVLGGAWPDRRSPRLAMAAGLGVVFAGYEAFRLLYFGDAPRRLAFFSPDPLPATLAGFGFLLSAMVRSASAGA